MKKIVLPLLFSLLASCSFLLVLSACSPSNGSPQTKALAAGTTRLQTEQTEQIVYHGHNGKIREARWSPDGKFIASIGLNDNTVQVWNAHTGQTLWKYDYNRLSPITTTLSWSPNGQQLAVGTGSQVGPGSGVDIFAASTGSKASISHKQQVTHLVWSSDSTSIASTSGDGKVEVWSTRTGQTLKTYNAGEKPQIAWSPNGKFLAMSKVSTKQWDISVLNLATGKVVSTYKGHTLGPISVIAWSSDNQYIASSASTESAKTAVHIWNVATGKVLFTHSGFTDGVTTISWSRDGKHIAAAGLDKTVSVLNAVTGSTALVYKKHMQPVVGLFWSQDKQHISSIDSDGAVLTWKAF